MLLIQCRRSATTRQRLYCEIQWRHLVGLLVKRCESSVEKFSLVAFGKLLHNDSQDKEPLHHLPSQVCKTACFTYILFPWIFYVHADMYGLLSLACIPATLMWAQLTVVFLVKFPLLYISLMIDDLTPEMPVSGLWHPQWSEKWKPIRAASPTAASPLVSSPLSVCAQSAERWLQPFLSDHVHNEFTDCPSVPQQAAACEEEQTQTFHTEQTGDTEGAVSREDCVEAFALGFYFLQPH